MKISVVVLLVGFSLYTVAQEAPSQPQPSGQSSQGEQRRGDRFANRPPGGTIQSISGDTLTLSSWQGQTLTVTVTPTTRFSKDGQAAKLSDFKVGDRVIISGISTSENHWTADMVGEPRRMGQAGGDRAAMMERMREGMGKEFLAGEIKSIDGTKLVIHGFDDKDYTAEVDENTSFRRGREDVTFPDFKVGDRIMGRGKPNSDGVFVFQNLNAGGFMRGPRNGEPGQQPAAPPKQ